MMALSEKLKALKGRLVVSCQAHDGDAFRDPSSMARFARAAIAGGAAGIRANGPEDVRAIHAITAAPILGIHKELQSDGRVLITPSFEHARALVDAGAAIICLDLTARGMRFGGKETARRIREELGVPVFADIATVEEAVAAVEAGVSAVLSTLRGYTDDTAHVARFEPQFIADLVRSVKVPVIAEGRIHSPEEARAAVSAGAFAVVVGTAITRPREITRSFALAVEKQASVRRERHCFPGIDLGGTNTKIGIVSPSGKLLYESHVPTPATLGRDVLLRHLSALAVDLIRQAEVLNLKPAALGVATAGWVDVHSGVVAYATENLPQWTGTHIAEELGKAVQIPVAVENDANALAVAEKFFGGGQNLRNFICITLGTGVGGGCYIDGKLNRGAHFFANAVGHICLVPDGLPCTCGQRGCLEAYTNAAALLRYSQGKYVDSAKLIAAANEGEAAAVSAIGQYAHYLALGCVTLLNLVDPEALIFSGGLIQDNPLLFAELRRHLGEMVPAWERRGLEILASPLGYYGGVQGAAAIAIEKVAGTL